MADALTVDSVQCPRWSLVGLGACATVLLATGCPAPRVVTPPAPPLPLEPAHTTAARVEPPDSAPFRRRVAQLAPRSFGVRWQLLGRSTLGVNVASDGNTLLQMRGYGGLLRTIAKRHGKRLPRRHFISSRFSPDARHFVLADERRTLRVFRVPSATLADTIYDAVNPRWIDARTIGFQRGCTAMTITLGGTPRPLGQIPAPCTEVLYTSPDFATWLVADENNRRYGMLSGYARVRLVDVRRGASRAVITGPLLMPRVSPDGRRICFARPDFKLYCASGGKTELVWNQAHRPLRFDETGSQLLFANRPKNDPRSRIVIIDFAARTAVITPRATREWWRFLPGGKRIVGHGGSSSAIVYDLDKSWQADVGNPDSEWEGLWTIPGDPNRFALGRERRGTRDVYLVTLPR